MLFLVGTLLLFGWSSQQTADTTTLPSPLYPNDTVLVNLQNFNGNYVVQCADTGDAWKLSHCALPAATENNPFPSTWICDPTSFAVSCQRVVDC